MSLRSSWVCACSVSRCGIQKDPRLKDKKATMAVWYVEKTTRKEWNQCHVPLGYLSKIAIRESRITVSSLPGEWAWSNY